ncbi:MAG: DNA repair protein RecO, partial [Eggerthellaceae bacterium]|nr:DNA repair protein RecO [Eggerthellaceae bacterium]
MASETFSARALVLRKTLMGESDLALSLLAENGEKLRCVAKGARKPTSTFSSRLELYSVVDIHCVRGKSLAIIKEARLVNPHAALRSDIVYNACAAPIAELLDAVAHEDLAVAQLFPMACSAFEHIAIASPAQALSICAAQLLKTLAVLGFRPSLDRCVHCGSSIDLH